MGADVAPDVASLGETPREVHWPFPPLNDTTVACCLVGFVTVYTYGIYAALFAPDQLRFYLAEMGPLETAGFLFSTLACITFFYAFLPTSGRTASTCSPFGYSVWRLAPHTLPARRSAGVNISSGLPRPTPSRG
jgi:hypothetical protein